MEGARGHHEDTEGEERAPDAEDEQRQHDRRVDGHVDAQRRRRRRRRGDRRRRVDGRRERRVAAVAVVRQEEGGVAPVPLLRDRPQHTTAQVIYRHTLIII